MNTGTILRRALAGAVVGGVLVAGGTPAVAGQLPSAPAPPPAAQARRLKPTPQQTMDMRFLEHAAQSAMTNDELGRLAAKRGDDPAVRRFGLEVVDTFRTATLELNEIARVFGIFLPVKLATEAQVVIDRITPLGGKAFDRQVMSEIWSQNTRDRSLFLRIANQAADPRLKGWASRALGDADSRQTAVKELTLQVLGAPPAAGRSGR